MALFELLSREEFDITPEETQQPEEIHPSVPEKLITEENEDQVKLLSSIMGTIDSLESLKANLVLARESGYKLSPTEVTALSQRVSLAYQRFGVPEEMPLHVSTESIGLKSNVVLAVEELDIRIDMLSTEADNIFRKLFSGIKDIFGREANQAERLLTRVQRSIEYLKKVEGNEKKSFVLKNGATLAVNGKTDIAKVIDNLSRVNAAAIADGGFFNTYVKGISALTAYAVTNYDKDKETLANELREKSKQFFNPGTCFVTTGIDKGMRKWESRISDASTIELKYPTGEGKLYPNIDNGLITPTASKVKSVSITKEELIKELESFVKLLQQVPNAKDLDGLSAKFKKQVKELSEKNIDLNKQRAEITKWNKVDLSRLVGSLTVPFALYALCGPLFLSFKTGYAAGTILNQALSVPNNTFSDSLKEHYHGNNTLAAIQAFITGGVMGLDTAIFVSFMKKLVYRLEHKLAVYYVNAYRAYYAALYQSGTELVRLAEQYEKE